MPSNEIAPGTLCRPRASELPLLILALEGHRAEAIAAPFSAESESQWFEASELVPVGADPAAARLLSFRRRAAQAERAFEAAGGEARGGKARPIRTAMVFCAGLGTRLRPLTLRFPKPAVPFFGAPLFRYSLALLKRAGIERVVINTHHLPEVMARVAREEAARLSMALRISREDVLQDTAGGLREARALIGEEPCVVLNGDAFLCLDLRRLIDRHREGGAIASLAVVPLPPGASFRAIEADSTGAIARIRGIGAPREGLLPWHFLGVHVVEPALLDAIDGPGPRDINGEVYPRLIAEGARVEALPVSVGAWADLGTPRRYLEACREIATGLADISSLGEDPLASGRLEGEGALRNWIDARARVGRGARLEGVIAGPDVEIGAGAHLRNCALLPGARVAAAAHIEDSVLDGDCRLDAR